MTALGQAFSGRARGMRAEFDASFAERPGQVLTDQEDVLLLRAGDDELAIGLGEVAGMAARPPVTVVPSRDPAMIGIVSDRGVVSAAWDLGRLLGLAAQSPRWLVVPAAEPGVAITFEHFLGFRRVESADLGAGRTLSLPGLVETIRRRCAGFGSESGA
jgi:chemotaxis signal transduction protein